MSALKLFYSDTFELPLPDGHRFPMSKYTRLRERIGDSELMTLCELLLPPAATREQLELVHQPEYVARVFAGTLSDLEQRRIGFPWSEKMVERSCRSTGASIAAGFAALEEGLAVNLAGGTHHAMPDAGGGYCVFNDACVAARVLQKAGRAQTVLFVDLDVHQGNGTAAIAAGDPTLFAFSMHCDQNYPFRKTEGDLDIKLPAGAGDELFLSELETALDQIQGCFDPDLVFYLAGADPWDGDRLGHMALSKSGLKRRDELVLERFGELRVPVAVCMAGGYAPEVNDIVDIHFGTVETAAHLHASQVIHAKSQ